MKYYSSTTLVVALLFLIEGYSGMPSVFNPEALMRYGY